MKMQKYNPRQGNWTSIAGADSRPTRISSEWGTYLFEFRDSSGRPIYRLRLSEQELDDLCKQNSPKVSDAQKTSDITWDEFEQRLVRAGFSRIKAHKQRLEQELGLLGDEDGDLV
jgi:hypothetical protein